MGVCDQAHIIDAMPMTSSSFTINGGNQRARGQPAGSQAGPAHHCSAQAACCHDQRLPVSDSRGGDRQRQDHAAAAVPSAGRPGAGMPPLHEACHAEVYRGTGQAAAGCVQGGCIAVPQPRRVAATAVAARVAKEMGVQLGAEVTPRSSLVPSALHACQHSDAHTMPGRWATLCASTSGPRARRASST